ncbi:MAG: NAD(P)/FAD-dependent oxidoreductase [Candidatus Sungbacteria bacterium]|nr:NAD(P)/FAD-dependent oxidoreductase [Candidatus Sungbacteria bacterium]
MEKTEQFDLIVIGTGAAGSSVADRCRKAGWSVAVIDELPFGGTCALRGCDPKKVLVGAADLIDWHRRMQKLGVVTGNTAINWEALMHFKRTFTDPIPMDREESYKKADIAVFHGTARFIDKTTVQVGNTVLRGRFIHVAVGAKPMRLGISGEEHLITSTQFLELASLPKRILFVGGGYISFEFAHVAARAGAKVTILHRGARPLEGFDSDLVANLMEATKSAGIAIELDTAVEAIEKLENGFAVRGITKKSPKIFEGDLVVHGAGRLPAVDGLDLEKADVAYTRKGITVNKYFQSVSNPAVYAAGDAKTLPGSLPLTPVAGYEGSIVATNLLEGNRLTPDYTGVPSVVFTIPPLATVGLSENGARSQGFEFSVNTGDMSDWYSSRRINAKHARYKVLLENKSRKIIGAHLLGPHAEEVINLFALAIRKGLVASDIEEMLWAYPTHASDTNYMVE